jgi:NADH-quinone oxidoreductase subunit J
MTLYSLIFYLVATVIVASTAVAITRRNMVHAVIYLILSFFGTALLFYLLGAPLLAVLEVIVYAGAIMVLFLFILIMIRTESHHDPMFPLSQWLPAALFGLVYVGVGFYMIVATPGTEVSLKTVCAAPREFALYVFQRHWFSIEIVSLLLLVALMGALHLGRREEKNPLEEE